MPVALLAVIVLAALAAGYVLYGRLIARQYALDDRVPTPAERVNDGVDFVPTKRFYLLSQHFSAIAAAGPIAGPILACQQFGWLPCVLWIGLGVIFIGAVHDFSALVASVRHRASSIAGIVRETLGRRDWLAILIFIWLALVYVIVAFTDVTAQTFLGLTEDLPEGGSFHAGGAVAAAATIYLVVALVMGCAQRFLRMPLWAATCVFVPATLVAVWAGQSLSTEFVFSRTTWVFAILAYCFAASVTPIWALLQPRGYLGGFVLYLALAIGVLGILFGGREIAQPALKEAPIAGFGGSLFPFLFVTIACGACSGFHGLVCSGTTSKQISKESHCRPIGFGAMLLEGFVALIALSTILILAPDDPGASAAPAKIYGDGMARFLTALIGDEHFRFAATFGAMAFSTFVFDTLDVATRLGRYIVQELFGGTGARSAVVGTALTVGAPLAILLSASEGAYKSLWSLFGTSNQLLAAITLLVVCVWLRREGRRTWFAFAPMVFVMTITLWSLSAFCWKGWRAVATARAGGPLAGLDLANGLVSAVLMGLGLLLLWDGLRAMATSGRARGSAPA